jgi:hypothetical protein
MSALVGSLGGIGALVQTAQEEAAAQAAARRRGPAPGA